jgi:hypothetical protein
VTELGRGRARIALCFFLAAGAAGAQQASNSDTFSSFDDRFRYYLHRTYTSRQRLLFLAADTALGHALNDPVEWGRAPNTFAMRLSSNFGRRVVSNTIELGASALLHDDARYRRSNQRGIPARVRYAALSAFTARLEDGGKRLAYSRFIATSGGVLVSSRWHPRCASGSDLALGVGFSLLGKIPDNLLDEFAPDLRRAGEKAIRTLRRR